MPEDIFPIRDNVFHIYESLGVYCTLVVGTEKALLIDTGFGFGDLSSKVRKITSLPIIVANTHGHTDHIQGNKNFDEVYIHPNDIVLSKLHSSFPVKLSIYLNNKRNLTPSEKKNTFFYFKPKKQKVFPIEEGSIIDLGNNKLEIIHTPGHTKGSICILDKVHRLLYAGDSFSSHVWLFFRESTSIDIYTESIDKILLRMNEFDAILPSHFQVTLKNTFLNTIRHCAKNISKEKSTVFDTKLAGKALLYMEGFEHIAGKYGYQTFEDFSLHLKEIPPEEIAEIDFASIVYSKKKLRASR